MTTKNQPQGDPFTFTLTAEDPFGFDNIFGQGNIFGSSDVCITSSTDLPVTSQSHLLVDSPTNGYAFNTSAFSSHTYNPIEGMLARIERLEREVEMFKTAAITLKEINDELRDASEENDRLTHCDNLTLWIDESTWTPKIPAKLTTLPVFQEDLDRVQSTFAYDHAMKVVK